MPPGVVRVNDKKIFISCNCSFISCFIELDKKIEDERYTRLRTVIRSYVKLLHGER